MTGSPDAHELFAEPVVRKPRKDALIVRVSPASKEAFLARAQKKGMTQSQAMREALRDWMTKA